MHRQTTCWALLVLMTSSSIISTLAYPNQQMERGFLPSRGPQLPAQRIERKFAEKSNSNKKVPSIEDRNDIETNEISEPGFTWSNLLGSLMHMIFNPAPQGPNKSENLDDNGIVPSPWANLLTVGLKILSAILGGGGGGGDGIDKVDNGSPMQGILAAVLSTVIGTRDPEQVNMLAKQAGQFINIVMNLMDALKTSFSHRSLAARNIGKKDSISDVTVAGITMLKGYLKSINTIEGGSCVQKFMCEANSECVNDVGETSLFCQLGTYTTSYILEKSTHGNTFDSLYEAGRRGRSGENCRQAYLECNEV